MVQCQACATVCGATLLVLESSYSAQIAAAMEDDVAAAAVDNNCESASSKR